MTPASHIEFEDVVQFQYRKRYEITCDENVIAEPSFIEEFQYRKRYEITCDTRINPTDEQDNYKFQYRKRYEITCDDAHQQERSSSAHVSIPQAV